LIFHIRHGQAVRQVQLLHGGQHNNTLFMRDYKDIRKFTHAAECSPETRPFIFIGGLAEKQRLLAYTTHDSETIANMLHAASDGIPQLQNGIIMAAGMITHDLDESVRTAVEKSKEYEQEHGKSEAPGTGAPGKGGDNNAVAGD